MSIKGLSIENDLPLLFSLMGLINTLLEIPGPRLNHGTDVVLGHREGVAYAPPLPVASHLQQARAARHDVLRDLDDPRGHDPDADPGAEDPHLPGRLRLRCVVRVQEPPMARVRPVVLVGDLGPVVVSVADSIDTRLLTSINPGVVYAHVIVSRGLYMVFQNSLPDE
ncbi:hypothetical protein CH63R_03545 [Colletotrichum higginsianum IMI 349063]|uniref:Uncharacterized protein n=1 Tax=Colletotrichum higginsianum (strain IMI 349063) TaxID=759273 RepID=A0A1B7YRZ6_COLHI|nr:hypothetical protein CH63R_03545 [Colletotrichum higginsianum IMI 349063]OBR14819.1 hypothetical protein CH63R_03545 [Colletotrichum higginsianum IMI 349063]